MDLACRGHRLVGHRRRHLGGADQQAALPRQHENHPAILGARNQKSGVRSGKARAEHQVGAGADAQQRNARGVIELAQAVHVGTGGVQHHACADRPGGAGKLVAHRRPGDAPARIRGECLHRHVVGHRRALLGGGQGEGEIHARVVELAVVVDHPAAQAARRPVPAHFLAQVGKTRQNMLARHELGTVQRVLAGEAVVQPQADPVVGVLAELIQRHEDRQLVDQVGRQLQQRLPFAQRLPHQAELAAVDPLHRLLQVTDAAVHELGAAAAGAAAEVGALHQRHPQAAGGGVERAAAAGGAAADHQQVEALLLQPAQLLRAPHRPIRRAAGGRRLRGTATGTLLKPRRAPGDIPRKAAPVQRSAWPADRRGPAHRTAARNPPPTSRARPADRASSCGWGQAPPPGCTGARPCAATVQRSRRTTTSAVSRKFSSARRAPLAGLAARRLTVAPHLRLAADTPNPVCAAPPSAVALQRSAPA